MKLIANFLHKLLIQNLIDQDLDHESSEQIPAIALLSGIHVALLEEGSELRMVMFW
jgi:hypothetical protein